MIDERSQLFWFWRDAILTLSSSRKYVGKPYVMSTIHLKLASEDNGHGTIEKTWSAQCDGYHCCKNNISLHNSHAMVTAKIKLITSLCSQVQPEPKTTS